MAQELSVKEADKKLVVAENRLAYVQAELERLTKSRDALQAEIDRKTSDYTLFVGQKDAESKKIRQDAIEAQAQLAKDKQEFQGMLVSFQKEKQELADQKQKSEAEMGKAKAMVENIHQFITAVSRANSLLGL